MPKDKFENHEKILKAAREEFTAKGFENASIREIGKKAGVTSAALYRHCKDKEDLFCQLVQGSVDAMTRWSKEHYNTCCCSYDSGLSWEETLSKTSELDLVRNVLYPRKEDFRLILLKSKGTRYENFLHELIEAEQKGMDDALKIVQQKTGKKIEITEMELHTLLTAYTSALLEPVLHDFTKEEMEHCMEIIGQFFMPGWKKIMGF